LAIDRPRTGTGCTEQLRDQGGRKLKHIGHLKATSTRDVLFFVCVSEHIANKLTPCLPGASCFQNLSPRTAKREVRGSWFVVLFTVQRL
jgi:hypothetical protein